VAIAAMTEVLFYHLTESTLEDALPALLERSLARGWRCVVQSGSEERRDALDAHLWTFRDDAFLAHGTDTDEFAAEQPVLLTTSTENRNAAAIRFLVDGAEPPELASYERVVFMFDGHDAEQVEKARGHWKAVKAGGLTATYWQQSADRRWERKA
jgi:DNA polymerase-3 subunit chi